MGGGAGGTSCAQLIEETRIEDDTDQGDFGYGVDYDDGDGDGFCLCDCGVGRDDGYGNGEGDAGHEDAFAATCVRRMPDGLP